MRHNLKKNKKKLISYISKNVFSLSELDAFRSWNKKKKTFRKGVWYIFKGDSSIKIIIIIIIITITIIIIIVIIIIIIIILPGKGAYYKMKEFASKVFLYLLEQTPFHKGEQGSKQC